MMLCKYFIPKKRVKIFFHSTKTEAVVFPKNRTKHEDFSFRFSKWPILRGKMARSAAQNDSFCRAKRAVSACRMSHFESPKNVKKTQVVCFQPLITFSYFAHTRPSDFYFGKMACISYNKCYFVSIIQRLQSHHRLKENPKFLHHFPIPNWRYFIWTDLILD